MCLMMVQRDPGSDSDTIDLFLKPQAVTVNL